MNKFISVLLSLTVWIVAAGTTYAASKSETVWTPPTSIYLNDSSIIENQPIGTFVGKLFTIDPDGPGEFAYALTEGEGSDDNNLFTIRGDSLFSDTVFNYYSDSVFIIQITSTDAQDESYTTSFAIKILPEPVGDNLPPTDLLLSNTSVVENAEEGTLVGSLSTVDPDDSLSFVYALIDGEGDIDNASFRIVDDQLVTDVLFDYEYRDEYRVRIGTFDSHENLFAKSFTITIRDTAEFNPQSPTNIILSASTIAENQADSILIGTFTTEDPDAETLFEYALVEGDSATDNGSFIIDGDRLLAGQSFNFEEKNTFLIRVQTTDVQQNTFSKGFVITVEDVDESQNLPPVALTLDNLTIKENRIAGTLVGTFTTEDPDNSERFTYAKVEGEGSDDNSSFRIVDDQLLSNEVFDFETKASYTIRISTTDEVGASFEQTFVIQVEDYDETVNQPPTDITLDNITIPENSSVGAQVGRFSTTDLDHDSGFTYALTAGEGDTGNEFFRIQGDQLLSTAVFDFETQATYQVRITTTDPDGATFARAFTILVVDADETSNQPPIGIILSDSTIDENQPPETEIGYFSVVDNDTGDRHSVTLVDGEGDTDNGRFQIRDKALVSLVTFDFESQTRYSIRVQAQDSAGGTFARVVTIRVRNLEDGENQAPTDIYLIDSLINEGAVVDSLVGILYADDADGPDNPVYTLVTGAGDDDNELFTISGNRLLTDQVFDYDVQANYRIRVRVDDQRGGLLEDIITIGVVRFVNAIPELVNPLPDLSATVDEPFSFTLPANTFTDANVDDILTYTLTLADSLPLPVWLTYNPSTQTLSGTPPGDSEDSLQIRVTATDPQGASVSDEFLLTITRVTGVEDEVPVAWSVYPVPTDQRHVTLSGPLGNDVRLRLLDTSGRVLRSYTVGSVALSEYEVELPATLSTGAYFLEIETPSDVSRMRILLQ